MGPTEQRAAAEVARAVWPLDPTSRRVARALVTAARVLDDDPTRVYPYSGRVRAVHDALLQLLGGLTAAPNALDRIRAQRLCRPVERGETMTNAELRRRMSALDEPNP